MPASRHTLTLSCADRPGIVAKVSTALFEGGFNVLEAQQFDDLETGNFFMRVDFDGASERADVAALRAAFRRPRRGVRHDLVAQARGATQARRADGVALRPLPRRPALPLAQRRTEDGRGRNHRQLSARDLRQHRFRRDPVPPSAGRERDQDGAGDAGLGDDPRCAGRCRRAGALHADPVRRPRRQAHGAVHQHPPLVPARLQGRQALSPGARARRQADRRHRAFRHRQPRRRPDHRTGGRAHHPRRHARRSGAQGPRHRAAGARPRARLSPRRTAC